MSTVSAIPDDQTYLKPKKIASSLKLLVAGAAALSFVLGAVVATSAGVAAQPAAFTAAYDLVDDDSAASLSSKNDLPAPGWDTCDWIRSNGNAKGQHRVGYASSPWECIAMVREFYPDATIANIEDSGTGSCYAQFGSEPKYQSDSIFKVCVLASMPPGSDLDTHGCKASAGFTWCDRTQSCLRDFDTPCSSAPVKDVLINGVPCRGENVVQSKFDDEACKKGEDAEGEVCSNDVAPGAEMWLDHFEYTCNFDVGQEGDTHCARCRVPLQQPDTPVDMMHQGQPVSCLLKNVVVVEDREMEHRIPEGDIGPDFGKHGKHLCKGPSKDGNVCANAGTDREAYCTYSLGPALYPEEFPVDYHFCAYCADDN